MVIAALIVFGTLLAAWLMAPGERASAAQVADPQPDGVRAALAEAA